MTKYDLTIIVTIVMLSVIAIFVMPKYNPKGVVVKVDGKVVFESDFSKTITRKMITSKYGYNEIEIGKDYVVMLSSDCPKQLAVKQGKIKNVGSSLICLPHHMYVTIVGESSGEDVPDVIVK